MSDFKKLRQANKKRNEAWDPERKIGIEFRTIEFAEESGELCGQIKRLLRQYYNVKGNNKTKNISEGIREEVGDVLITLDLLCMELGLDLFECTKEKFNKTSIKHNFSQRL